MISDFLQGGSIRNEIRNAPEVHCFAGRSRLYPGLVLLTYLAGVIQLSGWALSGALLGASFLTTVLTLHCVFAFAMISSLKAKPAVLSWSPVDVVWRISESKSPPSHHTEIRRLSVCLDMFGAILLKTEDWSGRSKWLWLDRASDPDEWKSIRRALYSPATTRLFQGR